MTPYTTTCRIVFELEVILKVRLRCRSYTSFVTIYSLDCERSKLDGIVTAQIGGWQLCSSEQFVQDIVINMG